MNHIDELLRSLPPVTLPADDEEQKAVDAARRALRAAIAHDQPEGRLFGSRRRGLIVGFAALVVVGIVVPAVGLATGWFRSAEIAGISGSAPPELTSPPLVVASGEPEEAWKIVVARSKQGLCLNADVGDEQFSAHGSPQLGDCGYSDIQGDLPPDVRGNPSAPCIGPTQLVPCGSLPKYSVAIRGMTLIPGTRKVLFFGAAAAGVASVDLLLIDGATRHANVVERPLGPDVPLNVYWAKLGRGDGLRFTSSRNPEGDPMPCNADFLVDEVIARDAAGKVLGGRVDQWNANPTGNPFGPHKPPGVDMNGECA